MLGINEVSDYLKMIAKKAKDEETSSADLVHELKVVSSLFDLVGTINSQFAFDGVAHAIGALMATVDRIPPVQGVNRPEDKKAILSGRGQISDLITKICDNLESLINLEEGVFLGIISSIYETRCSIDSLAKHFVSMLPPIK
jgi:hypothetical protein